MKIGRNGWIASGLLAAASFLAACSSSSSGGPAVETGGSSGDDGGQDALVDVSADVESAPDVEATDVEATDANAVDASQAGDAISEPQATDAGVDVTSAIDATEAAADAGDATTAEAGGCIADAGDTCPTGMYCSSQLTCVQGCKTGADCTSGSCGLTTHECDHCLLDAECGAGHLCSSGQCMSACSDTSPVCGTGFTCCGTRCADTHRDAHHCGNCATACSTGQFCGSTGCKAPVLANICESPKAVFLLDGLAADDAAATVLKNGLAAACPATSTAAPIDQAASGAINASTGQPVAGSGQIVTVTGGPFGQHLVGYLEAAGITPVYNHYDSTANQFLGRSADGGTLIVNASQTSITDSHSYFLVETVQDTTSDTLVLVVYGLSASGTRAAAWYFVNNLLPLKATLDNRWYVYEWTDSDADLLPSAADQWTFVLSGP